MLKKFVKIQGIGKFRAYNAIGDLQLKKMNLIYSENGRGKTTISNILRSLTDHNPELVIGRKTLGSLEDQTIEILTDSKMLRFKNSNWLERPDFKIEIFDSHFINENVFSGHLIDHDQKKQLYLFTLGADGVTQVENLFQVEEQLRLKNVKRKELEKQLVFGIKGVLSSKDFISLRELPAIDNEIQLQKKNVAAFEKEAEIKSKSLLQKLELPKFDKQRFEDYINKHTYQSLVGNAEELTKQHIAQRLDDKGEKWIEYGVKHVHQEECPFCTQDISNNEIFLAFKAYFSDEYKKTNEDLEKLENGFNTTFKIEVLFEFQKRINDNRDLVTFWNQYVKIDFEQNTLTYPLDELNEIWEKFTQGVYKSIEQKKLSPLEPIEISNELNQIFDQYGRMLFEIDQYNISIDHINSIIDQRKKSFDKISLQNEKTKLDRLDNTKIRYSDEKKTLIKEYEELSKLISGLEKQKKDFRSALDQYTETIFKKYEAKINIHLKNCGASFSISDYRSSFQGGKPSSNFTLKINDTPVKIGGESLSEPCFRNTLSEGDKSSLAFAFFLAKLESDAEIHNKVIIFDDPICSLDNHRKTFTANQILRFSAIAKQVIVLTHDSFFSRIIWQNYTQKDTLFTQLIIKRSGTSDSSIDQWNIEEATRSEYYQSYFMLADFIEGKTDLDLRAVARCIRPLVEGNLRLRFPHDFKSNEWLGNFIEKVRLTTIGALLAIQSHLIELEEINNYSKKYHHDQNPLADGEPISDTELISYVERTLKIIKGIA